MTKQYEVAVVSELLNQKLSFFWYALSVGGVKRSTHKRLGAGKRGVTKPTDITTISDLFIFFSHFLSLQLSTNKFCAVLILLGLQWP